MGVHGHVQDEVLSSMAVIKTRTNLTKKMEC